MTFLIFGLSSYYLACFLKDYFSGSWTWMIIEITHVSVAGSNGIGLGVTSAVGMFKAPSDDLRDFPGGLVVKNPPASAGDIGLNPGSGRCPGGGMATHSNILAWEIPCHGSWRATVHWVTKSQT